MIIDWQQPEVDALEAQRKYREALDYMVHNLKTHPDDLKGFIRLGFLCWYIPVEWGILPDGDLTDEDYKECQSRLRELTDFGLKTYRSHPEFLWIFGYMISLFPEVFVDSHDAEAEMGGIKMLEAARVRRPEDPIIQLVISGARENEVEGSSGLNEQVARLLPERFKGTGEMQQYFREVLDRTDRKD